ncbi:MAG: hypothetical protein DRI90_14025 [Deltaproteobacteria bacterium]|nr:MAG: hypothetical protein DRI90_14025 [Deltaproteobacteria bacterium]
MVTSEGHPLAGLLCLALTLALFVGACNQDGPAQTTASAASASVATASSDTNKPARRDTRSATLARLFTGVTSQSVVGYRLVHLPGQSALEVREPPEWKTLRRPKELRLSRDKDALLLFQSRSGTFELAAVAKAAKSMKLTDVAWGDPVDGQLGARRLPGKMADGMARLHGEEADIWYFALPIVGAEHLLVVAAVKRQHSTLRSTLIDCLKSLRPKP